MVFELFVGLLREERGQRHGRRIAHDALPQSGHLGLERCGIGRREGVGLGERPGGRGGWRGAPSLWRCGDGPWRWTDESDKGALRDCPPPVASQAAMPEPSATTAAMTMMTWRSDAARVVFAGETGGVGTAEVTSRMRAVSSPGKRLMSRPIVERERRLAQEVRRATHLNTAADHVGPMPRSSGWPRGVRGPVVRRPRSRSRGSTPAGTDPPVGSDPGSWPSAHPLATRPRRPGPTLG